MVLMGCGPALRAVDPEASEKRYLLGADYYAKGAVRPALEELLKAVELNPQNPEAHNLLGIVFLRQAADSEEMTDRTSCIQGEEGKLEHQEQENKLRAAEEQFRAATTSKPDYSEAWNNLAVVELRLGRWDEAIVSTEKALGNMIYSDPWAAQGNLGWAYFQKRDFARAAKELRTALTANPKFCVGRYRLARVFYEQSNLAAASTELEALSTEKCPIQEAYQLLGLISLKRGEAEGKQRAADAFRRCVALAPQSCLARQCRTPE